MKINNLVPRTMKKFNSLEYGECFIYDNTLYMKVAIYNREESEFMQDRCWDGVAVPLPGGYANGDFAFNNPDVECVDIEVNITKVLR